MPDERPDGDNELFVLAIVHQKTLRLVLNRPRLSHWLLVCVLKETSSSNARDGKGDLENASTLCSEGLPAKPGVLMAPSGQLYRSELIDGLPCHEFV